MKLRIYAFRWLQPESYLDPKQCDVVYNKDELKCSWPATFIVQAKDQYGQLVHVPNLKVNMTVTKLKLNNKNILFWNFVITSSVNFIKKMY